MTALPSQTAAPYLVEAINDEATLAKLLGWTVSNAPITYTPTVYLKGSRGRSFARSVGMAMAPGMMVFMPQWRRSNDAFELIARCNLNLVTCDKRVAVEAGTSGDFVAVAEVSEHPTKENAIRYAMCKAAIAYLTAEREERAQ